MIINKRLMVNYALIFLLIAISGNPFFAGTDILILVFLLALMIFISKQEEVLRQFMILKIGENVCIHDIDFHLLKAKDRNSSIDDKKITKRRIIVIGKNVFIDAYSTILKGASIGENSIVGACSVVTKNIPSNEVWAGNPAKFIRKIDDNC